MNRIESLYVRVPIHAARRGRLNEVVVAIKHVLAAICRAGGGAGDVIGVEMDIVATVDGGAALVAVGTNHTTLCQAARREGAGAGALLIVHEILRQRAVGRLDLYLQLL